MRVALTEPVEPVGMQMLQAAGLEIVVGRGGTQSADELRALCRDADAVVVRQLLPPDLASCCPKLLIASRHGVGVDLIPVEDCTAQGVVVSNVPGANADAVAEFVVAQMLAASRNAQAMSATLLGEGWLPARALSARAFELRGRTIGIVGVGAIGTRLAEIAHHGFRMQVLGHQRRPEALPGFVAYATLERLFSESDFVVLACPLTPETRGLASAALIARMKPGAWLCNVSRGGTVDEPALVAALQQGRIGGAALDVFAAQPLAEDHPLRALPNVVLSPHCAGISGESATRMSQVSAEEVVRVLRGEKPMNFINPEAWERHLARRAELGLRP